MTIDPLKLLVAQAHADMLPQSALDEIEKLLSEGQSPNHIRRALAGRSRLERWQTEAVYWAAVFLENKRSEQ